MEYRIETYNADGLTMRYLIFGKGKKVLVILPGLSIGSVLGMAKSIVQAYALFAEEYTVYLFDRREDPPEKYTVADMARDTYTVAASLGLREIYLYGVSQGGMIAQLLTLDHPGSVKKLALASTSAAAEKGQSAVLEQWIEEAGKGRRMKLGDHFARAVYTEEFVKKYGAAIRLSMLKVTKKDLSRFVILAEGTFGFSTVGRLREIGCPVLVLGAENDKVIPVSAQREIADETRGACFIYPPPYGHAVYDEAPDFKERVFDFFGK